MKRVAVASVAALVAGLVAVAVPPPQRAAASVVVDGAGSTWSQIAVDQWRADVARQGLTINYQGVGSSAGRVAYYQGQVDFAVSEIPFQTGGDSGGVNEVTAAASRPYAYLPIVAGGTAFMYHVVAAGKRVTDLRLSPETVAKIFTGEITNWNDPAITADNNGRVLPSLAIKPVIRSDGSGTSAQFTAFMVDQTPAIWSAFCQKSGLGANCPPTSLYPNPPGAGFAAQQFSDGVANFVAAPYNNGSITYVEYGYAKERGFPVASVRNKAGAYVQPVAQAVAIALQGARINPDGTQILKGVYEFADARSYPVSSYSYMIVPTTEAGPFNAAEGLALGNFILYFLCAGQQKAEQLGYSPLPRNLVQFGFDAVVRIPGAPAPPSINSCSNPTITGNFITGAGPVTTTPPPAPTPTTVASGGGSGGSSGSGGSTGSAGSGSSSGAPGTTVPGAVGGGDASPDEQQQIDPLDPVDAVTGEPVEAAPDVPDAFGGALPSGGGQAVQAAAVASPLQIDDGGSLPTALYVMIAIVVLLGVFGLPGLALALERRKPR